MDFVYQAEIARAFGEFVGKGLVTFGYKAVLWCVSCKTALAEAEVEYKDRLDPSIYVAMPVESTGGPRTLWGEVLDGAELFAVVWTTTPWTLPANRAIALGKDVAYVLARRAEDPKTLYLLAEDLVPAVAAALKWDALVPVAGAKRTGAEIAAAKPSYRRPFRVPGHSDFGFVVGEHVSTTDGTGLVHTAPGHGRDDYEVVKRSGFDVNDPALCPVDDAGFYDVHAPEALRGKRVVTPKDAEHDANTAVLAALESGDPSGARLLASGKVSHSYPHCWRCKNPVVFRATHQWFIDLAPLRGRALAEIRGAVTWVPAFSANRIAAMVENRLEWTISRQRRWGSPITFLLCTACKARGEPLHYPPVADSSEAARAERERFFAGVVAIFRENGADAWYDDARFPASAFVPAGARCGRCGGSDFEKVRDILDVWFDSGVSHAAVLRSGAYGVASPYGPATEAPVLYLEGHDQHRGWFQSSLLTSVALSGSAPYDTVVTHGFLLEKGEKMSKSAGTGISPQAVTSRVGADVLRLLFASSDSTDDVSLSEEILKRTGDAYFKLRNTARFLLSVLFDFQPERDAVADTALEPLDRFVLDRAARLVDECRGAFDAYAFHSVARRLVEFATADLSALWCDVRKDALYVRRADDPVRRSAQTAAYRLTEMLALLLDPICPFTAEEVWESLPGRAGQTPALETYDSLTLTRLPGETAAAWDRLVTVREAVQALLEPLRKGGVVGSSAQAAAELPRTEALAADLAAAGLDDERLAELLIVPEVAWLSAGEEARVRPARGTKCARCWQVRTDVDADELCARCRGVLGEAAA
jgi:isoleucyl-tRNA synthetase